MKIMTADWDPSFWTVSCDGENKKYTRAAMLDGIPWESGADVLVIESAHLRPRVGEFPSPSQVYFEDELEQLETTGRILKFPERRSSKYKNPYMAEHPDKGWIVQDGKHVWKKALALDAEALRVYLERNPNVLNSLPQFRVEDRRSVHAGRDSTRQSVKLVIQNSRFHPEWGNGAATRTVPSVEHALRLVDTFLDDLPDYVREFFKIDRFKRPTATGTVKLSGVPTRLITAYALVFDEYQNLRTDEDGNFIGVRYLMDDVAGLHSFGFPNIARSQINWHGVSSVRVKADGTPRPQLIQARKALKIMIRSLRDAHYKLEQDG